MELVQRSQTEPPEQRSDLCFISKQLQQLKGRLDEGFCFVFLNKIKLNAQLKALSSSAVV